MQSTCPIHVFHFAESYELQHPMVGDCTCHAKKPMGPLAELEANRKNQVKLQKAARRQEKLSRLADQLNTKLNASTETVENLSKNILSSEEVAEIKAKALNEAAAKRAAEIEAAKAAQKAKVARAKAQAAKKDAALAKKLASLS